MTKRWHGPAAAMLAVLAGTGCDAVEAQDKRAVWEHGVVEWVYVRGAKEEQERYSWATATEEIRRDTAAAFFSALGVSADAERSAVDRLRVLDHLAAAGWEVVNRTDVAYADAGGTAVAERYLVRRPR